MAEEVVVTQGGGVTDEDFIDLMGTKVARCQYVVPKTGRRCKRAANASGFCNHHNPDAAAPEVTVTHEVKALKKHLTNYLRKANGGEAKTSNEIQNLITAVGKLDEKLVNLVTQDQMKQLGYYFASILFNYIQDGTRYDMAKKDFIDAMGKALNLSPNELELMANAGHRTSTEPTPAS